MNVRALALGAMVGFVVAIAPACSPPKCGPSNCDGCCDSSGSCVKKPDNGLNTTCGSAGNACVDCVPSGATCNPATNTCGTSGVGGGSGTGGGTGTACAGCRLSTGTCVPPSSLTPNNCGSNGDRCVACAAGQTCNNGTCETPPPVVGIGSACTDDGVCQTTLGASAKCRKTTPRGDGTYRDGYCTIECATNATCTPHGAACLGGVEEYGEVNFCVKLCSAQNCRTGYQCYGAPDGFCWIAPPPARDAGTPADKVGNPCTDDTQCQNPPANGGVCLQREFNYNWQALGGYCSRENCGANSDCSSDGGAMCLGFTEDTRTCVQRCPDARDGGQSTCRTGYVCEGYVITVDGGQTLSNDGYCAPPPAPEATSIGGPCTNDAECSVPTGAIADCFPPTLPDGGASAYTGGYCTRFECESDDDCGAAPTDGGTGNRCLFSTQGNQQFSFCYKGCSNSTAGAAECRTGYTCDGYGLADGGRSVDGYCNIACNAPGVGQCPNGSTCNATSGYCTLADGGIL